MQEKLLTDTEINYKEIKEKITEAAKSAGRDPSYGCYKNRSPRKNQYCDKFGM